MKVQSISRSNEIEHTCEPLQLVRANSDSDDSCWGVCTFRTLEQIRTLQTIWQTLKNESGHRADIEADFNRYVSLAESLPDHEPYVLLLLKEGKPHAMLIGILGFVEIPCTFGYLEVLKPSLKGVTVTYGGYLGDLGEETCRKLVDHLYASTCRKQADVVIFRQLPLDSPLYSVLRKQPPALCRNHFLKIDGHWQMSIPDQMDAFYAYHSSKTRQTLKRQVRQIESKFQVRLAECTDAGSMPEILSHAAAISSRTYQHGLGCGLIDDAPTRKQLTTAAENGWLQLHVLYLNDEPCAFQFGLRYEGRYFLQQMGFNPDLKQWHAGTVLFLKVLERLCEDPEVNCFDFGFGDAEYKKRFGTNYWEESTLYLYAPRVYPVFVNMLHATVSGLSEGMRFLAQKTGIEGKIKRKWRNLLQK
ncbi:MAG: GNAT family N-acetyltransferase [Planctomycetota bacterium]|jgi:hypothetical protein